MTFQTRCATGLFALAAGASRRAACAQQPDAGSFYKDKTVTFIVSAASGGGYDLLARTLSRHMGRHIPGAPNIIVQNMPGGGALQATNYVFNIAPKDGTVVGALSNNTPFEPLFGTKEARYDASQFAGSARRAAKSGCSPSGTRCR